MSGFSAAWLGLREPADHAARSVALSARVGARLADAAGEVDRRHPVRILDLATGTGSNPRYLAPYLPAWQDWTLLDADADLLAALPSRIAAWATRSGLAAVQSADGVVVSSVDRHIRLRPRRADISRFPIDALTAAPSLVTASALLDLVSEAWLSGLVTACADAGAAALFALTYDGRTTISPAHPDDELVVRLVNLHQTTDKGFGEALGPAATSRAESLFRRAGYQVAREPSDWRLSAGTSRLQAELIAGWAQAACEIQPEEAGRVRAWERARDGACHADELEIVVGHEDLAAWPV